MQKIAVADAVQAVGGDGVKGEQRFDQLAVDGVGGARQRAAALAA